MDDRGVQRNMTIVRVFDVARRRLPDFRPLLTARYTESRCPTAGLSTSFLIPQSATLLAGHGPHGYPENINRIVHVRPAGVTCPGRSVMASAVAGVAGSMARVRAAHALSPARPRDLVWCLSVPAGPARCATSTRLRVMVGRPSVWPDNLVLGSSPILPTPAGIVCPWSLPPSTIPRSGARRDSRTGR